MDEIIQENVNEEKGISLNEIMQLLWRNIILIAIITVIATACGVGYAMRIKPTYTATRSLIVKAYNEDSSSSSSNSYNDITVATKELPTIAEFFKKPAVLKSALEKYGTGGNGGKILSNNLSVSYDTTTRFLTVSYTDGNEEVAVEMVKCIVQAGTEVVEEKNVDGTAKYFNVSVELMTADDNEATVKVNLSRSKYIVIGFLLGLVLAVAIVFIKYFMDDTVRSKEELENISGVKMLAYLDRINAIDVRGKNNEEV